MANNVTIAGLGELPHGMIHMANATKKDHKLDRKTTKQLNFSTILVRRSLTLQQSFDTCSGKSFNPTIEQE